MSLVWLSEPVLVNETSSPLADFSPGPGSIRKDCGGKLNPQDLFQGQGDWGQINHDLVHKATSCGRWGCHLSLLFFPSPSWAMGANVISAGLWAGGSGEWSWLSHQSAGGEGSPVTLLGPAVSDGATCFWISPLKKAVSSLRLPFVEHLLPTRTTCCVYMVSSCPFKNPRGGVFEAPFCLCKQRLRARELAWGVRLGLHSLSCQTYFCPERWI